MPPGLHRPGYWCPVQLGFCGNRVSGSAPSRRAQSNCGVGRRGEPRFDCARHAAGPDSEATYLDGVLAGMECMRANFGWIEDVGEEEAGCGGGRASGNGVPWTVHGGAIDRKYVQQT